MADPDKDNAPAAAPADRGVSVMPITKRDADEALRKSSAATARFFRSEGPLASRANGRSID